MTDSLLLSECVRDDNRLGVIPAHSSGKDWLNTLSENSGPPNSSQLAIMEIVMLKADEIHIGHGASS